MINTPKLRDFLRWSDTYKRAFPQGRETFRQAVVRVSGQDREISTMRWEHDDIVYMTGIMSIG